MAPACSIVVVVYDMDRELPRTLATLAPAYQRGLDGGPVSLDYEVIVVDNGSPTPVDEGVVAGVPGGRVIRLDPAPPSPAAAANAGLAAAAGDVVGVLIDGARMLSPGVVAHATAAMGLGRRVIAATLAFHLGDRPQMAAVADGYDQSVEDALLDTVDWRSDGYELFSIAVPAGSSARGWFGPMGESNAVFMPAALWAELGGFDEAFDRPGGGLVNHDLWRRACEAPDTELVVLLGEGSFHQFHGGAATGGGSSRDALWAEYERLRGRPYEPPARPPVLFGRVTGPVLPHLEHSLEWRRRHEQRSGPVHEQ